MKKTILLLLLIIANLTTISAKEPQLKFDVDGKFKIVQLTDIHFKPNDPKSTDFLYVITEMLELEKPDFVILTGDIVWGAPAEDAMRSVLDLVAEKNIPFAVTFGNHDHEFDLNKDELFKIVESYPLNCTKSEKKIAGVGNCYIPIKSSSSSKNSMILYCFDSHAYTSTKEYEGYDYVEFDQIEWYRDLSTKFTKKNNGVPIPSLAFFHIPFPEFTESSANEEAIIGTKREGICAPTINSGLFVSMKEMKDILGVFVGHDHNNDFSVYWKGILLSYGLYSGGDAVYNNLPSKGCRVIELTEGERGFKTWLRLNGGRVKNEISFPEDFPAKK